MSQNQGNNDPQHNHPSTGGAGTGATGAGTTRDTSLTTGGATTGTAAATAREGLDNVKAQAQEYGQKVADAATQAKDYVSEKVSVVGDKLKDLQNKDFTQVANEAKDYAREKPGQALLISAAAGFLIGLLLKGGKRR